MRAILLMLSYHVNGTAGGELIEVPVIALEMSDRVSSDRRRILAVAGHSGSVRRVLLTDLRGGGQAEVDPDRWFGWGMRAAHRHLVENFDHLRDGDTLNLDGLE